MKPWLTALIFAVAARGAEVTFRDVQPILAAKCQSCHRPGEVAPMSLVTHESSRPWAKAIKTAVLTRKMPPWSADLNPDPSKDVWWGDQTWEEMMIRYFGVLVKNNVNPGKIVAYSTASEAVK